VVRSLALVLVLACVGCGDVETTAIDVGPTGNPTLAFSEPAVSGGEAVCVSLGDDAETQVPLLTTTTELILRPPGACRNFAQCGHLGLFAAGVLNNESAVHAIDLLVRKLADPYHDGGVHQGTGEPDVLRLAVVVLNDAGDPLLDHQGEELRDELDLITVPECP
jgi:hypothetical protein